jgi:SHS2 domain-containing protein
MSIPYERIEHTADLAIRVTGRDLLDLFVNVAAALFDLMADPPKAEDRRRDLVVEATDVEELFVDWLNQLIFLHEVYCETYTRFDITALSPTELRATVYGGPTSRKVKTIKAATFHELVVAETDEGAFAQVVFDV